MGSVSTGGEYIVGGTTLGGRVWGGVRRKEFSWTSERGIWKGESKSPRRVGTSLRVGKDFPTQGGERLPQVPNLLPELDGFGSTSVRIFAVFSKISPLSPHDDLSFPPSPRYAMRLVLSLSLNNAPPSPLNRVALFGANPLPQRHIH